MYMYFIYFYNASGFHFVSVFAMSLLKIEFFMAKQKEQDRVLFSLLRLKYNMKTWSFEILSIFYKMFHDFLILPT